MESALWKVDLTTATEESSFSRLLRSLLDLERLKIDGANCYRVQADD
jgi:hypothetical protein